jgi:2-dehydro-3-deoxyphosphooctonate aldolase (KDO 8-P synthase)
VNVKSFVTGEGARAVPMGDGGLFLLAGPCVIESRDSALRHANALAEISASSGVPIVFKSSYDKANRTSHTSYRGPGMHEGLEVLADVKKATGLPVVTDIHETADVDPVAQVADVLQIPAFLCRQTNLINKAAASGRTVNIKKGQFLAPWDMQQVVAKARSTGNQQIMVCERGASFGYNNLISDMRSLAVMRETACPVVFDATHSVQLPGGHGSSSGGHREHIPVLARAAVAAGVAGLFMETHPRPEQALSDGPNAMPLEHMQELLTQLKEIDSCVKRSEWLEDRL